METTSMVPQNKSRIRLAVSLFFFCQGMVFASWACRIPNVKANLNISEATLGTLLLMLPIGQITTMTLSGRLVTHYGSKKMLELSSIFYATVLCSIPFVQNVWMLGLSLFFFGVFSNLGNIAVNTQGVGVENMYNKPIMSSFHGAWSLAGFIGALIGLGMMHFGINILLHFIIIFLLVIINWIVNRSYLLTDVATEKKQKGVVKPDRQIIQLGIICFLVMATEGAMFDWSGVYFKEIVKAPEKWVILGYTAFMITMASGRFLGDFTIKNIGISKTLQVSGLLMCSGLVLSVLFPSMWICTLAFMMVGLGVATVVPTVYSVAGKHQSIAPGQALAMVSSISFLGFLLGPPIIGYIGDWLDLRYSYAIFSSFGLILFFLVTTLKIFKK